MSLITRPPSDETRQALLAGLSFFQRGDPSPADLANRGRGLPIFALGLQPIVRGEGLLAAEHTSWRFLARSESGLAIAADVTARPNARPKMAGLWRGARIENAIRASDDLEKLPEVGAGDYELRVLRISGLHLEAFWLKSAAGGGDLLVPFLTLAKELRLMRPYPAEDFLRIIRGMAEKQLEWEGLDQ